MKPLAFITGFLLLTSAVAVPFLLKKRGTAAGAGSDENVRYDIDDYMGAEGL